MWKMRGKRRESQASCVYFSEVKRESIGKRVRWQLFNIQWPQVIPLHQEKALLITREEIDSQGLNAQAY